jgi:hypothetical protein
MKQGVLASRRRKIDLGGFVSAGFETRASFFNQRWGEWPRWLAPGSRYLLPSVEPAACRKYVGFGKDVCSKKFQGFLTLIRFGRIKSSL